MTITGIVNDILPVHRGNGKKGDWQRGGFILETESQYPKKIALTAWGDIVNVCNNLIIGEKVSASIEIESREYNGRWYTDIKAYKIERQQPDEEQPIKSKHDDDLSF